MKKSVINIGLHPDVVNYAMFPGMTKEKLTQGLQAQKEALEKVGFDEVRVDGLMGQVRLRIGDQTLTAMITADAIDELKLRRGDTAVAIIKSTEVMIAKGIAVEYIDRP